MSDEHTRQTCKTEKNPRGCTEGYGCMLCNCFYCGVCGGFEGTLTTKCPGHKVSDADLDLVYTGTLDYVDGCWVNRPYHEWESNVRNSRDQERLDRLNALQPQVRDAVIRLNWEQASRQLSQLFREAPNIRST